jgi:hypothetical protein
MKAALLGPAIFLCLLITIMTVFAHAAGIRLSMPRFLFASNEKFATVPMPAQPPAKPHDTWCARGHVTGGFCVIR